MNKTLLTAIAAMSLAASASAGPSEMLNSPILKTESNFDNWLNGKYATGNWGGLRDDLEARGIEPFLYYTAIASGNPIGGRKQGFTYVDDFYFGVNLHLEKLIGWKGAEFTISGINRDGVGLSNDFIGSQFNVQQTVGGQNLFFYQLTLEQHLFNDKLSIKIGRFGASDDFNASPIYSFYVNNAIDGDVRNVLFDTQFSAYPFATWAARLRLDPSPEFNAELGVFQTWDRIFDSSLNGVNWSIHSADGVILMAQAAWTPEFNKQPVPGAPSPDGKTAAAAAMKGVPGHYWLGATFSPWNGFTQFQSPRTTANSYGFYAHADQMVYQPKPGSDAGLTLWTAAGYYPQDNISIMPFQINVGSIYKGLIPGREDDRTILGVMYGQFSRNYAHALEVAGQGDPRQETVLEAAYRIQIAKFAFIQPDFQWVFTPAGTGRIPDAFVLGAEMGITF